MRKIRFEIIEIALSVFIIITLFILFSCEKVQPMDEMRNFHEERIKAEYPNQVITLILFDDEQ